MALPSCVFLLGLISTSVFSMSLGRYLRRPLMRPLYPLPGGPFTPPMPPVFKVPRRMMRPTSFVPQQIETVHQPFAFTAYQTPFGGTTIIDNRPNLGGTLGSTNHVPASHFGGTTIIDNRPNLGGTLSSTRQVADRSDVAAQTGSTRAVDYISGGLNGGSDVAAGTGSTQALDYISGGVNGGGAAVEQAGSADTIGAVGTNSGRSSSYDGGLAVQGYDSAYHSRYDSGSSPGQYDNSAKDRWNYGSDVGGHLVTYDSASSATGSAASNTGDLGTLSSAAGVVRGSERVDMAKSDVGATNPGTDHQRQGNGYSNSASI